MEKNSGKRSYWLYSILFMAIVLLVLYLTLRDLMVLLGAGIAFAVGFLIYFYKINETWQGTIEEFKTVTKHSNDEDEVMPNKVTYAIIKLDNGKKKKLSPYPPGWKIGDKIIKEKGIYMPKKVSK